jgi:TPR repeat protein/DNA-directed RNA polymerase subunit RPC12/RpoP
MKWYYLSEENEVIGPVSETALSQLKACGEIKNETRICREGTEDWITSVEIPDPVMATADMPELFKFNCPHCSQHIEVEASHVGMEAQCPACGGTLLVPKFSASNYGEIKLIKHTRHKPLILSVLGLAGLLAIGIFFLNFRYSNKESKGVPIDNTKTLESSRKAAEQGQAEAQFMLGEYYAKGEGVPQDDEQATEWFRKAAEQGHIRAQCMLGNQYQSGVGVPKNYKEATKWYRKAAEQGDTEAQRNMGLQYGVGFGVQKDEAESAKWYHKAAIKGDISAQIALGVHYNDEHDTVNSLKWFRKAAEQGDGTAQYRLGMLYAADYFANGELVPKDDVEATKWFRKAAEQGGEHALMEMALRYDQGLGVPKDEVEATKWFRKIAKKENSPYIYSMGCRYAKGYDGVQKDLVKAYMWFIVSDSWGAHGHWDMEKIAESMTKDQIAEAQKLSNQWLEKNAK